MKRTAHIVDIILEGKFWVSFTQEDESTMSMWNGFYPTKLEAEREVYIFENQDIYKSLSN